VKIFEVSSKSQQGLNAFQILSNVEPDVKSWMGTLDELVGLPLTSKLVCPEHGVVRTYDLDSMPEYSGETVELFTEEEWSKVNASVPIIGVLNVEED